jgi:DNA-binding HxlR family transcriptional regulator
MDDECTIYKTVDFMGKRWTLLILLELYKSKSNSRRYSEIKNNLAEITPKVLSARLKELEKEGLIKKKIDTTQFPVKCEYTLTSSGKDFITIIKEVKQWALKWKIKNIICEKASCKECSL